MLLSKDACHQASDRVTVDDFYKPAHGHIFEAITSLYTAGEPADPVTVADELARAGLLDTVGGQAALVTLQTTTPATSSAGRYAKIVNDHAVLRRVIAFAGELSADAYALPDEVSHLRHRAEALIGVIERGTPMRTAGPVDVDDLLAETDLEHDWLVPGLLERGDRLIITAGEGDGKSTLLRQIGLRCASGQHPFTGEPITPVRTLVVDCENSRRQVRRAIAKTRGAATGYQPGHLRFECRPAGLDLLDPSDQAWLNQLVNTLSPDMLMIGPLYKLAAGDPVKEETAREVSNVIDSIRARTGVTLVMEAHTPYADGHRAKRPIRPYGASLWSRWPEFGICLTTTGALEHWRGPREERAWPAALERSTPWPWAPRDDIPSLWAGPTDCMAVVARLFGENPELELGKSGVPPQLKALFGSSFRRDTIYIALEQLVVDGILDARTGPRHGRYYRAANTERDEPVEMF